MLSLGSGGAGDTGDRWECGGQGRTGRVLEGVASWAGKGRGASRGQGGRAQRYGTLLATGSCSGQLCAGCSDPDQSRRAGGGWSGETEKRTEVRTTLF